mgnify:CR=1 FL=1
MAFNAQKLAEYIQGCSDFIICEPKPCYYNNHIGALFTDIILQAGVNYDTVVRPRVSSILKEYPQACNVDHFNAILHKFGYENVLRWNNPVKLQRMKNLISFCRDNNIQTANDLVLFLSDAKKASTLKEIKGIGNKTYDYLLKLMNVDTVAVDRHIFSFIKEAGITSHNYQEVKSTVEFAADFLGISRRCIDYSIWSYMSMKQVKNKQLVIQF